MAKKFANAGSNKAFENVGKKSAEKAQVITIQYLANENLIDNPDNEDEDVDYTEDLELAMRENGFTDPIEITDFGMEDGKYMILSGHRRRTAGVRVGFDVFPCLIRHFENQEDLDNYYLLANAHRDSARNPFLFCSRYKRHESYLIKTGFKGNIREEVAKRLGLSIQQADRYNTMNKIILPIWDLIRGEIVGMSSVQPIASHSQEEQMEILSIMKEAISSGVSLTRETMKKLVEEYRNGKRTWAEISESSRERSMPLSGLIEPEIKEQEKEPEDIRESSEGEQEISRVAIEADSGDSEGIEPEQKPVELEPKSEQEIEESENGGEADKKEKKSPMSEDEKQIKRADDIMKLLHKLDSNLSEIYQCIDKENGLEMLEAMGNIASVLIDEMFSISEQFDLQEAFEKKTKVVVSSIENF